jgi:hypothetical protein
VPRKCRSTVRDLGVEVEEALQLSEQISVCEPKLRRIGRRVAGEREKRNV